MHKLQYNQLISGEDLFSFFCLLLLVEVRIVIYFLNPYGGGFLEMGLYQKKPKITIVS